MKSFTIKLSLCVLALAVLPIDCFGKKNEPPPAPPDPKFAAIDQIVILPVVDARAGKKDDSDIDSLLVATVDSLKRKNYTVTVILASSSSSPAGGPSCPIGLTCRSNEKWKAVEAVEDLNEAKPDWIKRLGPPEARWVMVVGLNQLQGRNFAPIYATKGPFKGGVGHGSTGIAEVFGFLFDKQDGSVLWKNTAAGEASEGGGLVELGDKGGMMAEALDLAVSNLLSSIPKLPKKHK